MRYYGNVELLRHQEDRENLIHASHTAGVDLAHINRTGGEELLEDDPVLAHLAGCDSNAVLPQGVSDLLVRREYRRERSALR